MNKSSEGKQLKDPTLALQTALQTLNKLTTANDSNEIINIADLTIKNGELISNPRSLIQRAKQFLGEAFSQRARDRLQQEKRQVQNVILHAITCVKSNHLLIAKMRTGNKIERQFAADILDAIQRFNALLDRRSARPNNPLEEELEANRISLIPLLSILPDDLSEQANKIQTAFQSHHDLGTLSPQEADAMRMKATTLLQRHGFYMQSINMLTSLHDAPIDISVDPKSQTSTLCLTLDALPGTVIKVLGSFKRNQESFSTPIPETFTLVLKSRQTGFPYPSQHTGWALADSLFPPYPHRLNKLHPLLQQLYEQKSHVVAELKPNGSLVEKAKMLIQLKREVFETKKELFLQLHQDLMESFLKSADEPTSSAISYFAWLREQDNGFDHLADTYHIFNERCMIQPYTNLQNLWVSQTELGLFNECAQVRSDTVAAILEEGYKKGIQLFEEERTHTTDPLKGAALEFSIALGNASFKAMKSIIQQHCSESLQYPAPTLSLFAQKIAAAVFKQAQTFLNELNWDFNQPYDALLEQMERQMKQALQDDIALFQSSSCQDPLVESLSGYYIPRE